MKKLIFIGLLTYAFTAFPQVRTTGGGGPDTPIDIFDHTTTVQDAWPYIDMIIIPWISKGTSIQNKFTVLEYKILSLEKKLNFSPG